MHSTRSSTPDVRRPLSNELSSYSMVSLDRAEEHAYQRMRRDFPAVFADGSLDILLKDPQIGKIVRVCHNYGQIRTVEPVLHMCDFFFDIRDCVMEEGESLHENDRVIFSLVIRDKRLCAVNVKHIAKRTISSPDFSRLIMQHSHDIKFDLPPLDLCIVCNIKQSTSL